MYHIVLSNDRMSSVSFTCDTVPEMWRKIIDACETYNYLHINHVWVQGELGTYLSK